MIARNDAELEALFSIFDMPELDGFNCQANKKIKKMCFNPECTKHSLLCNDQNCEFCGEESHEYCRFITMKGITKQLSAITGRQKEFSLDICKIEDKFIEEIKYSKVNMVKNYYLGDLEEKYLKIVKEIYEKKNRQCLVGQEAEDFFERLKKSNDQANQQGNALLQTYRKILEEILQEILNLKNQIYEAFVKSQKIKQSSLLDIDSKILKRNFSLSTYLENKRQLDLIIKQLEDPKEVKLLYRASENNFSAKAFHQKCGDKANTLTLVRTEFGKTIAAFTPYAWHSVPDKQWVSNAEGGCFILALENRQKLIPHENTQLIGNFLNYGPIFGAKENTDFVLLDECNKKESWAGQINGYNTADKKYQNNQTAYTALTGATNGNKFRVLEYQVFQVVN